MERGQRMGVTPDVMMALGQIATLGATTPALITLSASCKATPSLRYRVSASPSPSANRPRGSSSNNNNLNNPWDAAARWLDDQKTRQLAAPAPVLACISHAHTALRAGVAAVQKVQQEAGNCIAQVAIHHHSSVRELFDRIDVNHDNMLSRAEIEAFAKQMKVPSALIHDTLDEYGSGLFFRNRGNVTFEEFAAKMAEKEVLIEKAFEAMDTAKNGVISLEEMEAGLHALNVIGDKYLPNRRIKDAGVRKIMAAVDHGRPLDYEHFRDVFLLLPMDDLEHLTPYYMQAAYELGHHDISQPESTKRKGGSPLGHLVAGAAAGAVSKTATSPLNVLATMAQVSKEKKPLVDIATDLYKGEGVGGFFKGNMANVIRSAPSKAIDFVAFDFFKGVLTKEGERITDLQRMYAGALAGATSTVLLYPLDVISSRMAISKGLYTGVVDAVIKISTNEGPAALFGGLGSSLVGVIPYSGINFGAYDILKETYKKATNAKEIGILPTMGIGMSAGWVAMTASFPLEVVRRRLQVQGLNGQPKLYNGMLDAFQKIIKEEGAGALFKGWGPASLKIIPSAGVSFLTYEATKRLLQAFVEAQAEKSSATVPPKKLVAA